MKKHKLYKGGYQYRFTWFTNFYDSKIGTRNSMYLGFSFVDDSLNNEIAIYHFAWNLDRGSIEPRLYKNHKLVARGATYTGV